MNDFSQPDLFSLELTPIPPFYGTTNPRHIRAIRDLLQAPIDRKVLDSVAGCRNAPELVAELRRRGLEIPCRRVQVRDVDGRICSMGIYYLTDIDRMLIAEWLERSKIAIKLLC